MISWIVASHDLSILEANLGTAFGGDELIVQVGAASIAQAYNAGQAKASHRLRVYVHHDVRITDLDGLRARLLDACTPDRGIVGVIGSTGQQVPWWDGVMVGSVVDSRIGRLGPGPGGPAAVLDGLLLATCHDLTWDETYPGWHMYDHDICRQQVALGRQNWCLDDGAALVTHNTSGPRATDALRGWDEALSIYRGKWPETS